MSARSAYRKLLRTVDTHITQVNNNTLWRDHIRTLFRRHAGETDSAELARKIELAKDYEFLVDSVQSQKKLLISYNISTTKDDRSLIAQSAARVGLQLPDLSGQQDPR